MVLLLFVAFFTRLGARPNEAIAGSTMQWLGPLSFGGFGSGEFGGLGLILAMFVIAPFAPALGALAFSILTGVAPTPRSPPPWTPRKPPPRPRPARPIPPSR